MEFIINNLSGILYVTYALVLIPGIIAILFSFFNLTTSPKNAMNTVFTTLGLAATLCISYFLLASKEEVQIGMDANDKPIIIDSLTSGLVGMGIWSFYIIISIAILSIIVTQIIQLINRD